MTFLEPAYGSRSLGDVLPAVARALGSPLRGGPGGPEVDGALVLPSAPSYVVFLVDGLGARLLERHAHAAPYLASLLEESGGATGAGSGTAGVPSTTATSLTSLGTSLTPGTHGVVGFTARVPGTDRLLNHLQWDTALVDPVDWQPHETTFAALADAGVRVTQVNKREFDGSPLTTASARGADFVGADKVGERIAAAVESSTPRGAPALTYLYDPDLDWTGHRHGVASSAWLQQLAMVDAEAEQLRDALSPDRRLLVVADHGMVDCPPEARTDVDQHLALLDGVAVLGGEARFRHLYCRSGAVDDVVATWREHLGDRADVLTRADAVARSWFGPATAAVRPRLGDVVVACHGDHGIFSSERFDYETRLVGLHGSLTDDEMRIPLLVG
ncbi:MAG: alkaline phosphatase family protein [Nocardioides sp.]|nr:alkaline phosphatase family protein [Nocardioides sp.]